MFGIGFPELIIILVVALVIFGPSKLPELGSGLGEGLRDFRRSFEGKDDAADAEDALEKPTGEKADAENPEAPSAEHGEGTPRA